MIYLKTCSRSLFDFVGVLQEKAKGTDFGSLVPSLEKDGLKITNGDYLPPYLPAGEGCDNSQFKINGGDQLVFTPENLPAVVEDILQIVRDNFPGNSFQQLELTVSEQTMFVGQISMN